MQYSQFVIPGLDLTPLQNATDRLAEALQTYRKNPHEELFRDGLIQRFEFTYELSHKTLKRFLEMTSGTPGELDAMLFSDQIRMANEQGLLRSKWPVWKEFRNKRSKSSHAYSVEAAMEVVQAIPDFLDETRYLLAQLQSRMPR
jgi:nucleotidyltransferase substrate binding protein (TIGR01987 family)